MATSRLSDAEIVLLADRIFIDAALRVFTDDDVVIGPAVMEEPEIEMEAMIIDVERARAEARRPVAYMGWEPRGPIIHGGESIRLARPAKLRWQDSDQQGVAGLRETRTIGRGTLIVEEVPDQVGTAYLYFFIGVPDPGDTPTVVFPGDIVVQTVGLTFVIGMPLAEYRLGRTHPVTRDTYISNLSLEPGAHTELRVGRI